MIQHLVLYTHKHRRGGGGVAGGGGRSPFQLGRHPFHLGNCSERTIGNSGNFFHCSPGLFNLSGKGLKPP